MGRGIKLLGNWYARLDHPFRRGGEVLVGLYSTSGFFRMCKNPELTDCASFSFQEFQIGFGLFVIAIGESIILKEENEHNNG